MLDIKEYYDLINSHDALGHDSIVKLLKIKLREKNKRNYDSLLKKVNLQRRINKYSENEEVALIVERTSCEGWQSVCSRIVPATITHVKEVIDIEEDSAEIGLCIYFEKPSFVRMYDYN